MPTADNGSGRQGPDVQAVLNGILAAASQSESEEDLRIRCEPLFRTYLATLGVAYEPRYEKVIASAGRTDSLFGKVVTEYKKPDFLRTPQRVQTTFERLHEYLEAEAEEAGEYVGRYAGVILDGRRIGFTHRRNGGWLDVGPEPLNLANVKLLLEHYRSLSRKPLEPNAITLGLGAPSDLARNCIKALLQKLRRPAGKTKLLFAEWRRLFGQVSGYEGYQVPEFDDVALAYGLVNDADGLAKWLFATHTYFAIVIKLIAAEILTIHRGGFRDSYVERLALLAGDQLRDEFRHLEEDHVFGDLGIDNFLEGDFFSWYLDSWSPQVGRRLLAVASHLQEYEPATSILDPDRVRDLLKNLYQNLVPRRLRHDLGEFYTPDWLAEYLLRGVEYNGDLSERVLDPNCGSGTFLVLAIRAVKEHAAKAGIAPAATLRGLVRNVVGFDLNPLAVIAARTNYLLAVGDLLRDTEERVEIPVYLSDSIFSPARDESGESYAYFIATEMERIEIQIPGPVVEGGLVGKAMQAIEQSVVNKRTEAQCLARLKADLPMPEEFWAGGGRSLLRLFEQVARLEGRGWNRIWCRIIKNRYASASVGHFDYIVGNPAWVRWSRLPVSYRETVKHVCDAYDLFSTDSWVGGIESDISTVLTYAAVDRWLKEGGRLGFVITQSLFKSKSSEGFRRFRLPGGGPLRVDRVDDLVAIKPFENADNRSAVLFLTRGGETDYPVPYYRWTRVPRKLLSDRATLDEVRGVTNRERLAAFPVSAANNAWMTCRPEDAGAIRGMVGPGDYEGRKCVTTDLNNVFWVQMTGQRRGRLVEVENNLDARARGVRPFRGVIEPDLLYPLVRGRDINPFRWARTDRYILVPQEGMKGFPEDEMLARFPLTADYFARYRSPLSQRSSYRRYQAAVGAPYYSLWNVGPYTFCPYKVVWREIGLPVGAAVLAPVTDPVLGRRTALPDHKLMMVPCETAAEAHYLCGFINSTQVRELVESFVVGIQVGARIFENVRIPRYDPGNERHRQLSALSGELHAEGREVKDEDQEEMDRIVRELFS